MTAPGNERPTSRRTEKSPRLFLSHAGEDGEAVKALARRLREAGLDVWLDLDELKPGDNWMEALERGLEQSDAFAVFIGRAGIVRWINREVRVALDRNTKDREFRFIPILGPGASPDGLPSFVAQHQWLDLRDGESDPAKIRELVSSILNRPPETVSLIPPGEAPFRGLLSFDSEHAHLFFGRDRETKELVAKLRAAPFLAVVGDSGSGKSSLVRAGLIPALHSGHFSAGAAQVRDWRIATLRPGKEPFRELAAALVDLDSELGAAAKLAALEACARQVEEGAAGVRRSIAGLVPRGARTLLVVDQFEEVFTHAGEHDDREAFIDTLLEVADAKAERPIHVIITLRADFYSRCFEHPALPAAMTSNQYAVRAIQRDKLVEVIEKPAAMAGLELEPGLVEAILVDLGTGAGNLALLEHTLLQLWNRRLGQTLTHEAYSSIGRVQGALEHHAEDVFGRFDERQKLRARKLLLSLVVPTEGSGATRRRARVDELVPPGPAGEAVRSVLMDLVEQRLLSVYQVGDGLESEESVEVAHEALIRGWRRLGAWLEQDREFLFWRQRTRTAFEAWETAGRDSGALLRGGPLAEAERWFAQRADDLSSRGRSFIEASLARAVKARRLRQVTMATIAILAIAATVLAFKATLAQRAAEQNFELAEGALMGVGELTRVARGAKAEQPEVAELKRSLGEQALGFFSGFDNGTALDHEVAIESAVARYRLGNIYGFQGESARADTEYRGAVERLEVLREAAANDPRTDRELANAYASWGEHVRLQGAARAGEAEELFGKAIGLQAALAGSGDPMRVGELARSLYNRGILRETNGRPEDAEEDYLQAISSLEPLSTAAEAAGGEVEITVLQGLARSYNSQALLLRHAQRDEEAGPFYDRALTVLQRLQLRHPDNRELKFELAQVSNNMANFYGGSGDLVRAGTLSVDARRLFTDLASAGPDIQNELANSYLTQASILLQGGDNGAAAAAFASSADQFSSLVEEIPERPEYVRRYVRSLCGLGLSGARESANDALDRLNRLGVVDATIEPLLASCRHRVASRLSAM